MSVDKLQKSLDGDKSNHK